MHQFFPEHRAGTEVLTLGLARALRSLGHQTAIFAAKRSLPSTNLSPGAIEDYAVEGVPVRRIGRPLESLKRPFRLNYENPEMAAGLRDYIREFRPDVVHFMHLQGLSAAAIPVVKEKLGWRLARQRIQWAGSGPAHITPSWRRRSTTGQMAQKSVAV